MAETDVFVDVFVVRCVCSPSVKNFGNRYSMITERYTVQYCSMITLLTSHHLAAPGLQYSSAVSIHISYASVALPYTDSSPEQRLALGKQDKGHLSPSAERSKPHKHIHEMSHWRGRVGQRQALSSR